MVKTRLMNVKSLLLLGMVLMFPITSAASETEQKAEEPGVFELNLAGFKNEDGFCYKNLQWGMSQEEIEEELGLVLELKDESVPIIFVADETVELEGFQGEVQYELQPDEGLAMVTTVFVSEEIEGDLTPLFDTVLETFREAYGSCEENEGINGYKIYKWMEPQSGLQITTKTQNNKIVQLYIIVGTTPSPEAETETSTEAGTEETS